MLVGGLTFVLISFLFALSTIFIIAIGRLVFNLVDIMCGTYKNKL